MFQLIFLIIKDLKNLKLYIKDKNDANSMLTMMSAFPSIHRSNNILYNIKHAITMASELNKVGLL